MSEITYAKAGGPPNDWTDLVVRDARTGELIDDVVEVNVVEGWLVRFAPDEHGRPFRDPSEPKTSWNGCQLRTERIEGDFVIEHKRAAA